MMLFKAEDLGASVNFEILNLLEKEKNTPRYSKLYFY